VVRGFAIVASSVYRTTGTRPDWWGGRPVVPTDPGVDSTFNHPSATRARDGGGICNSILHFYTALRIIDHHRPRTRTRTPVNRRVGSPSLPFPPTAITHRRRRPLRSASLPTTL